MEKTHTKGTSFQEGPGLGPWGKILKSVPLTMHFQHSGAKIRVFEQNTDIIFYFSDSKRVISYLPVNFISSCQQLQREPLVVLVTVLNHVNYL